MGRRPANGHCRRRRPEAGRKPRARHRTPRFHHAAQRRSRCLAARGAGAAGGGAGGGNPGQRTIFGIHGPLDCVPPGSQRNGLRRGPKCRDPIALGRGSIRPTVRPSGRSGPCRGGFATGVSSALAAKAASSTIPLVFLSQDDPVKLGFVTNFNRPGGNATGMSLLTGALVAKRLEFMRQLVPAGTPIAYLMNPQAPESEFHLSYMQAAARDIGQQFIILNASSERDIDNAFAALLQERTGALIVSTDPFLFSRYHQIVVLAAYHKLPTIYDRREFVAAGGLISYGTHLPDAFRQIGVYVGKILMGTKPSDLPVIQPTKYELVINLKTAKALGLEVPDRLLALADEVIE